MKGDDFEISLFRFESAGFDAVVCTSSVGYLVAAHTDRCSLSCPVYLARADRAQGV